MIDTWTPLDQEALDVVQRCGRLLRPCGEITPQALAEWRMYKLLRAFGYRVNPDTKEL